MERTLLLLTLLSLTSTRIQNLHQVKEQYAACSGKWLHVMLMYSLGSAPSLDVSNLVAQEVARAKEKAEMERRAKHVRPWDRGKGEISVPFWI